MADATFALVTRHRARLDRALVAAGVVSTLVIVGVALLLRQGDWPRQRHLLVYTAPVVAYGAAWARERLGRVGRDAHAALALDAAAFVAGAVRAGGPEALPYSGHMLFLSYAALAPGGRALRVAALLLGALASTFKLVLWHDWPNWGLGVALGAALAVARVALPLSRPA